MNGISIILPDGVAASGVAFDGEFYYACDGFGNCVYSFDVNGRESCVYETVRPYKTLRYDPFSNGFVAVGTCCGTYVYYLDDRFREYSVMPSPGGARGTLRYVGVSVVGALLDLTYDDVIIRCDRAGEYVSTVGVARRGTDYLGYDEYEGGSAVASETDGVITVSENGSRITLPICSSFRGFLPFADKMSIAVGYRYLYTHILPLDDISQLKY